MITRKTTIALAVVSVALVLGMTRTAQAQYVCYGAPVTYVTPAPVVVVPAPVVVSTPVYCYPQPMVSMYSAPVIVQRSCVPAFRSGFSFGFGWSGGGHRHCRW